MNGMQNHAQDCNNTVHPPFFWMWDKLPYTFLFTNVLMMLNPSCTDQPNQDLLIEVDTYGELCSLTYLTSTPYQSTLKCMPYNRLLIIVVCVLLGKSTYFLLTILV